MNNLLYTMKNILFILILIAQSVSGQSFGQNKVQYGDFDWKFIKSPHFNVYYYTEDIDLAEFTAEIAENAYEQISKHFRWNLKKPVSILVYNSHKDFQQTNVTYSYLSEGIGGVTELFKNRVVIPFEGSYEQFRHVIHHELVHAVVNDMVYGGNIQSVVSGAQLLRLPLWVSEGTCEYLSSNWDTKADMIIRDMTVNDYIPSVKELEYYMAYKGGQSVMRFIAEKYGREKIGEIYIAMKKTQNAERGFEQALGMDFKDLTEQWQDYVKKEYWPDITGRDAIEDIAHRLTDHEKLKNYYNISPALSPDGSKIAILSDRSMYADIFLIDAHTGKQLKRIIKGNRTMNFEELKWLQPGISWSPDSRKIVIAAKSGGLDAFHLIDIETGDYETISFKMDGLFTAAWSPDGQYLAFVGNQGRASDIYILDIFTQEIKNMTDDIFSDSEPVWNNDGTQITFISDRGDYLNNTEQTLLDTFKMYDYDYSQTDIYTIEVATKNITRLTDTEHSENYPVWAHNENKLLYTADENGVWNIHMLDIDTNESHAITNILTGIQQLSLSNDDKTLIFSGYDKRGWDIFSLINPLEFDKKEIPTTNFLTNKKTQDESFTDLRRDKIREQRKETDEVGDYSNIIFSPNFARYNKILTDSETSEFDSLDTGRQIEKYTPQVYKTNFTLDLVSGNMVFDNIFGAQGMTYFAWSDVLGDHRISVGTEMQLTLENSDYLLSYAYLKNRTDFYFMASQTADLYSTGYYGFARLRRYGFGTYASRPFNRFNRIDVGLSLYRLSYNEWEKDFYTGKYIDVRSLKLNTILPSVSWVMDNTSWGYTGPVGGFRQEVSFTGSPSLGDNGIQFGTMQFDGRKYFRLGRYYTIATRVMAGTSFGRDAQKFFLGGLPVWLFGRGETNGTKDNSQFPYDVLGSSEEDLLKDIYFTNYAMPIRGARYAERRGTNVAMANIEFRFPFIQYLALGFPLKVIFGNIQGHVFLDVGAAWDSSNEFSDFSILANKYGDIPSYASPIISSFGLGMKINLGYFLVRFDTAWDYTPGQRTSRPQYYISLGPDW
ncbi:peptidase MA family metallohydrolase [Candidatus Neomarinimicrobiota bacterium]